MVTLRTDIDQLPLDGSHVLVGTLRGEVLISRYVAANKHHPAGRWSGLASTDWPVAWLEIPAHPYAPTKPLASGEIAKP
jgi:hypothetical protein